MGERMMSSEKRLTKRSKKTSNEQAASASVKDTVLSAHCLVENSADNIEGMIKLLKNSQKAPGGVNKKVLTSSERLKTAIELLSSGEKRNHSQPTSSMITMKSSLKTGKSVREPASPPPRSRSFIKKPEVRHTFMLDPYLKMVSSFARNVVSGAGKSNSKKPIILCSMKEPIRIQTVTGVNGIRNGCVNLEQKIQLFGTDSKAKKTDLVVLRPKMKHFPPPSIGAKYRRPESDLILSAYDGHLRLIRTVKLDLKERNVPAGMVFEETKIYCCENVDDVLRTINSKERSLEGNMEQKSFDPAYAKCYQKILMTKDGNYKVIDFIELRSIGSCKEPNKELISKSQKKMKSAECSACNYEQVVHVGEGLMIIETAVELPTSLNAEETSYEWQEARSYKTNNYRTGFIRSPLPVSRHSLPSHEHRGMPGPQTNVEAANHYDESPPGSGLSDTSAGGGSESGGDHSPRRSVDRDLTTAKGRGPDESPRTAVGRPSSTNTAVSPSSDLYVSGQLRRHKVQDDDIWSKSATIWRKRVPYKSPLKTAVLQTPTSKRSSQNRSREVFQVTEDKTQLDGESAEPIQLLDAGAANEPGTVTISLADEHGLQVAVAANLGLRLLNEDGTRGELRHFHDPKVIVDGRVIYEG